MNDDAKIIEMHRARRLMAKWELNTARSFR